MTIFTFALIRGFRNPLSLICNAIIPLGLIFVRNLWVGDAPTGFGMVALAMMTGAYLMAQGILKDKEDGAIIRILSAPVSMLNYFMQNLLACMVPPMIQVALLSTVGFLRYDWKLYFTLAVALCYTMFTMATVAFSFAWHSFFKSKENSNNGFMAAIMFIAALGGLLFPVSQLPGFLQYVGAIFPAYWVSQSFNILLEGGISSEFWLFQAILFLFTVAYLLYGGKRKIV